METFSALLALCAGNSPVAGEFPSQRPVTRSFIVLFDLRLKNGWVNNREAGDLRRHRAHYDATVMSYTAVDYMVRPASYAEWWNLTNMVFYNQLGGFTISHMAHNR